MKYLHCLQSTKDSFTAEIDKTHAECFDKPVNLQNVVIDQARKERMKSQLEQWLKRDFKHKAS